MDETSNAMAGKICIVTGANSGIGKATALGLAKMGGTVVMVCRDRSKGETAQQEIKQLSNNEAVDLMLADLASQQSIRQLAEDFRQRYSQLHILVNNAGSIFGRRRLSVDGIEMTFAVNHLASFLLTNLLLDMLKSSAPARIVNVSSESQFSRNLDLEDWQSAKKYSMMEAYGKSKLANVLFTYELARQLEGSGVTVNCLHPGVVSTNIWSQPLPSFLRPLALVSKLVAITPEDGARTSLYLATSPEVEGVTGKYFDNCKERPSARATYDKSLQEQLWKLSEEMVNFSSASV